MASTSDDRGTARIHKIQQPQPDCSFLPLHLCRVHLYQVKTICASPGNTFYNNVCLHHQSCIRSPTFPSAPLRCILIALRKSTPGMILLKILYHCLRYIYWAAREFLPTLDKGWTLVQGSVESATSQRNPFGFDHVSIRYEYTVNGGHLFRICDPRLSADQQCKKNVGTISCWWSCLDPS